MKDQIEERSLNLVCNLSSCEKKARKKNSSKLVLNKHVCANPFSPNRDQHQISPCNINVYSTSEVMRIKDMITQGEFS